MCTWGVTRGVVVSRCPFFACHQCYSAVLSLGRGLNFEAVVCGIFCSWSSGVSLGTPAFSLPFSVNSLANKIKTKLHAISTLSNIIR